MLRGCTTARSCTRLRATTPRACPWRCTAAADQKDSRGERTRRPGPRRRANKSRADRVAASAATPGRASLLRVRCKPSSAPHLALEQHLEVLQLLLQLSDPHGLVDQEIAELAERRRHAEHANCSVF